MTRDEYRKWYFERYKEYPSANLMEKFKELNCKEEPTKKTEKIEELDLSFLD